MEEGVGTQRAGRVHTPRAGSFDGGSNDAQFLIPHVPPFAGVRVQPAYGDASLRQRQVAAGPSRQQNDAFNTLDGEMPGDVLQRQVRGGECDAQPPTTVVMPQQHHRRIGSASQLGEELGLAHKGLPGPHDGRLVDRCGDQADEFTA